MKHQHGLMGYRCLTAKPCSSPTSLYKSKKGHPFRALYRTHTNATAAATGPIDVNTVTQGHNGEPVPHSKRFENVQPFSSFLTDTHSRQHTYLRISLTERCNLRCTYCMPEAGVPLSPQSTQLTTPEILLLSSIFVSQGVNKIRLTGGEPTVRKDIVPLMQQLGDLRSKGLKELCITSNGIALKNKLESMHKAGLSGVNLSLDTLDPGLFMIMTRRRGFERVVETMERILEMNRLGAGIDLKINVVVMKGVNDSEILRFVELGKDKDLEIRFIEYMPFDENRWTRNKMVTFQDMLNIIRQKYPNLEKATDRKGDTSKKYRVPGFKGRIGFITSMTNNFCSTCNRLRITSDGNLKVCLFGNTEVSLRDLLRKENHGQPINEAVFTAMKRNQFTDSNSSYMSDQKHENELLQAIGQAVGRKKAQHAGMGVLEKTKNRPMILIDEIAPIVTKPFSSRLRSPNYFGMSIADMSVLQPASQPRFQRLFSTAAGMTSIRRVSIKHKRSFKRSISTMTDESRTGLLHANMENESDPEVPSEEDQGQKNTDSSNEFYEVMTQLEKELKVLREQVQTLASQGISTSESTSAIKKQLRSQTHQGRMTHLDQNSAVHMISVSNKPVTKRRAVAVGKIRLHHATLDAITSHSLKKGDVLSVARIAAIQAVKKTSDIIPLCHSGLSVEGIKVFINLESQYGLKMVVIVESSGKTGVEMEALTGVTAGMLTVYDMCKSIDKGMSFQVHLNSKTGGKSNHGFISRSVDLDIKRA